MVLWMRGAVRAGGVFLVALIGMWALGWRWEMDASLAARPALFIVVLEVIWARIDTARLGPVASEWVWAHAAIWVAAGVSVAALLRGMPVIVIVALVAGVAAGVAVPAWAAVGGAHRTQASMDGPSRPVSAAAMTVVTVGGVAALLVVPLVVLGWLATIAWTGCFIECKQPDHFAAVRLAAGAGVLLIDLVAWGMAAWRRFPRVLTGIAAVPLVVGAAAVYLMR
ncbi:hypothetical protein V3G39_13915 [Dermatophilaceae bacterium Sec6.4]